MCLMVPCMLSGPREIGEVSKEPSGFGRNIPPNSICGQDLMGFQAVGYLRSQGRTTEEGQVGGGGGGDAEEGVLQ